MPPTIRTATADLVQLTWVEAGHTYSREFDATEERAIRAARLGRLARGARNVSTVEIPANATYTEYGAH